MARRASDAEKERARDGEVVICEYAAAWPACFEAERLRLGVMVPGAVIEHIGSTAVPGLAAKPVIDIMVGASSLEQLDVPQLETLGFQYLSHLESVMPQRRFFSRGPVGERPAVHIHAVVLGATFWCEHLAFRDALRSDAGLRDRYAALKRELAQRHRRDRAAYTSAKAPFIRQVLACATGSATEAGGQRREGCALSNRAATQADIPFLLALRRETMDAHLQASGAGTSEAYHMERLLYRFDCAQVLLDGDVPVGLLKVCREPESWEIVQIQLGRSLQGRGLGRSILESTIAEARRAGAPVSLSVLKANPARHLYERLGFVVTSESEHEYRMLLRP